MADFTEKKKAEQDIEDIVNQQNQQINQQILQQQTQLQQTQAQLLAQQQQQALQQQMNLQTASSNDERRDKLDVPRGDNTYVGVGINHMTKDHDLFLAFDEGLGTNYHQTMDIIGTIPLAGSAAMSNALFSDIISGSNPITSKSALDSLNAANFKVADVENASKIFLSNIEDNFKVDSSGFNNMTNNDQAVMQLFERRSQQIINNGRIELSDSDVKAIGESAWSSCIHKKDSGGAYISFDVSQRDAVSAHMSWKNELDSYKADTQAAIKSFTENLYENHKGELKLKDTDEDTVQKAVTALGVASVKDELKKDADKALKDGTMTEAEHKLQMRNINNIRTENKASGINGREGRRTFKERVVEHGLRDRDGSDFTGDEAEKGVKKARQMRHMKASIEDTVISATVTKAETNKSRNSALFGDEAKKAEAYKDAYEKYKNAYTSEERRQAREELRTQKAQLENATATRRRQQKDAKDRSRILNSKSDREKERLTRGMDRRKERVERANAKRSDSVRRINDRSRRRGEGIVGDFGRINDKIYNSRVARGLRRFSGKFSAVTHPLEYMKRKIKKEVVKKLAKTALGTAIKDALAAIAGAISGPVLVIIAIVAAILAIIPFLIGGVGYFFGGDVNSENGGVNDMALYQEISDALADQELAFINTAQSGATAALKAEANKQKIKDVLSIGAGVQTYADFDPVINNAVTRYIFDEYGNMSNNMSTTIPVLTMTKYRIVDGLGENNAKAAIKYATYLWGGEEDFDSSTLTNPKEEDVTGIGEKAYITDTNNTNFTYATWSGNQWTGPNHQIKYHAMPGDVTIDFSTDTGFMSFFTKDNTCAVQGEHHDDIDMCSAPAYHGTTVDGKEHVMKELSSDCDDHTAIQGDLKEGTVVHKHTPGQKLVSAAYDEIKKTGKGKNKKETTVHHDAVYEDIECTDEHCPGYENYDTEIFENTGEVVARAWHSEEDPGDYNTWYICNGHCPGHLTPMIDYVYISDYRNLAAMDNKKMSDCLTASDKVGTYLSNIFSKASNKEDTDLDRYTGLATWNHWNRVDLTTIRSFIGDRTDNYKRGQNMYESLKVDIKFVLANGMTSEDYYALLESVNGVVGPGGRDPSKTQRMLEIAASRIGRPYIWGGHGGDEVAGWDCAGFVTSAIIGAWGAEPDRGVPNYWCSTATIRGSWTGTGAFTNPSQLKAGSVLVNSHHTILVYPNGDGTWNTLEAESSATGCVSRNHTAEYLMREYPLINNDWAS